MLTITYQDHVNKIQKEELQSYLKEKKEILDRGQRTIQKVMKMCWDG